MDATLDVATFGECHDLGVAERRLRARNGRRVDASIGFECQATGLRCPQDAERIGQFAMGEEAGLCIANRQPWLAVHRAVVFEEEQPDVAVLRVAGDADFVLEGLAGRRKVAVIRQRATE